MKHAPLAMGDTVLGPANTAEIRMYVVFANTFEAYSIQDALPSHTRSRSPFQAQRVCTRPACPAASRAAAHLQPPQRPAPRALPRPSRPQWTPSQESMKTFERRQT